MSNKMELLAGKNLVLTALCQKRQGVTIEMYGNDSLISDFNLKVKFTGVSTFHIHLPYKQVVFTMN